MTYRRYPARMRRPVSAMSVVIALVLATFGAFASGAGGLSGEHRMPEVSSSPAVAAQFVVAAPAELRGRSAAEFVGTDDRNGRDPRRALRVRRVAAEARRACCFSECAGAIARPAGVARPRSLSRCSRSPAGARTERRNAMTDSSRPRAEIDRAARRNYAIFCSLAVVMMLALILAAILFLPE